MLTQVLAEADAAGKVDWVVLFDTMISRVRQHARNRPIVFRDDAISCGPQTAVGGRRRPRTSAEMSGVSSAVTHRPAPIARVIGTPSRAAAMGTRSCPAGTETKLRSMSIDATRESASRATRCWRAVSHRTLSIAEPIPASVASTSRSGRSLPAASAANNAAYGMGISSTATIGRRGEKW